MLVLAPSRSQERVRAARRELRAARADPQALLERRDGGEPRVVAVGEVLDVAGAARRRPAALPIDVARTVEEVLGTVELDFVHVHEPFAPSTADAALRHSRALNVGSFHSSSERLLSTLLARRFVESFFGRLDARTASSPATAELMGATSPATTGSSATTTAPAARRFEAIYERAGRAPPPRRRATPQLAARLAARPLIDVDLHMHTDHSHDCATPVEVLLATAREQGLGAIAVTDHNEISGALEARAQAAESGVKVIVGEEVKTAGQGEVIGLFIEEKIPRGMTLARDDRRDPAPGRARVRAPPVRPHALGARLRAPAAVARRGRRDRGLQPARGDRRLQRGGRALRRQVPDRRRARARTRTSPQGLGSVRIRMRDFDGPQEFLQSLRDAEIVARPSRCSTSRR